MYANVDDVETKLFETTKPESHKNYIDIQFMVKGSREYGLFCGPWSSKAYRILS